IIGSGKRRYVAYLKSLGRRSKVPVRFVGAVPRRSMHKMYWMADCVACPTQGHEAFGLVIAEALASGAPTVASRNGGMKEIIKHGYNGMLVRHYRSPHAFAREMIKLAKHRKLSMRISKN